jgi:hypothetical protein
MDQIFLDRKTLFPLKVRQQAPFVRGARWRLQIGFRQA